MSKEYHSNVRIHKCKGEKSMTADGEDDSDKNAKNIAADAVHHEPKER